MNGPQYLGGVSPPSLVSEANSRSANMKYSTNGISKKLPDLRLADAIVVNTLRYIELGKELLATSGSSYWFAAAPVCQDLES